MIEIDSLLDEDLGRLSVILATGHEEGVDAIFVGEVEVGSFLDEEVGDLMALIADGRHESGPSL